MPTVPVDKQLHFFVGIIIATWVLICTNNTAYALGATFIVGIGKELWDQYSIKGSGFDLWDLLATMIGGVVGASCYILRDFIIYLPK